MRIGSLCSGYGGLDSGVQAVLGGETVWVSDVDKGANKILAHRYPDVPNLGDMTTVDWAEVEPVDVLTAGYPCQPFSHAGRRKGTDDVRHLWPYVREAVRVLRPRLTVLENVAGHRSLGFDRVLGDLAEDGMHVRWASVRASDVGAPHQRERLFIVVTDSASDAGRLAHGDGGAAADSSGVRRGAGWTAGPGETQGGRAPADVAGRGDEPLRTLPTPTSRDWKDHTIRREPHRPDDVDTLARALTDVPCALLPTPAVNDMGDRPWANPDTWDAWVEKHKATGVNGNGHGKSLAIEAQRLLPTPTTADSKASGAAGYGGNEFCTLTDSTVRQPERWGDYAAAIARWEHVLGRLAPAPTVTSAKGNPQLSPVFVEWLMGLPAGWVTDVPGITRNEALKALGNGVCPPQAAAALRLMLASQAAA